MTPQNWNVGAFSSTMSGTTKNDPSNQDEVERISRCMLGEQKYGPPINQKEKMKTTNYKVELLRSETQVSLNSSVYKNEMPQATMNTQ